MTLVLGIDTGGTFTDGVVLHVKKNTILATSKAETTHHDLSVGIHHCMKNLLGVDFAKIKMVSLSTTLATNAIVEGQGSEVGLILIGFNPHQPLPTSHLVKVKGGHDVKGNPREELHLEEIKEAIMALKDQVEAFAVSGYLSVRNPEQEMKVRELILEMTDHPVVCGYQLSSNLGIFERTATAVLNARLIPIITGLVEAVKKSMDQRGIKAPLMVVKGDGSLISEEMALLRPIETILSGPAASLVGAMHLTGLKDALVVDMGGTTTDVALLQDQRPSLTKEGALVGGWLTRVKAAHIITTGIGGDSHIRLSKKGLLTVGPQKVFPLSWIVHMYPHLLNELKKIKEHQYNPINSQPTDILVLVRNVDMKILNQQERAIIDTIRERPYSLYELGSILATDPDLLPYERLVGIGAIHRASLTPTDILHFTGEMDMWNQEAARLGVLSYYRVYGDYLKQGLWNRKNIMGLKVKGTQIGLESFLYKILETIYRAIGKIITQRLLEEEGVFVDWKDPLGDFFFHQFFKPKDGNGFFQLTSQINLPIIAIGAPVRAYFPKIAERLHAPLIIPQHAEVANAVGTVTGKVIERLNLLVKPGDKGGYLLHAPWGREGFVQLEAALQYALKRGEEEVRAMAKLSRAYQVEVLVDHQDIYAPFATGQRGRKDDLYVESRIEITAIGRPTWDE